MDSKYNVPLAILACALGQLVIHISKGLYFDANPADAMIFLIAYGLPVVMMALALWRGPQTWHAAMALAGFGIVAVRGRVWHALSDFTGLGSRSQAALVMLVIGLVMSVVMMRSRARAERAT